MEDRARKGVEIALGGMVGLAVLVDLLLGRVCRCSFVWEEGGGIEAHFNKIVANKFG